jgi:uncharacterized protein (TIGR02246 family)
MELMMRKRFLLLVAASVVLGVAWSARAELGTPADEAAIRKILEVRNIAYNNHDARALAAAYAQDADLVTGAGRLVSGRAEIEKNYVQAFAGVDKNAVVKTDSSKLRFLTSDTAILDLEGVTTGRTDGTIKTTRHGYMPNAVGNGWSSRFVRHGFSSVRALIRRVQVDVVYVGNTPRVRSACQKSSRSW